MPSRVKQIQVCEEPRPLRGNSSEIAKILSFKIELILQDVIIFLYNYIFHKFISLTSHH